MNNEDDTVHDRINGNYDFDTNYLYGPHGYSVVGIEGNYVKLVNPNGCNEVKISFSKLYKLFESLGVQIESLTAK